MITYFLVVTIRKNSVRSVSHIKDYYILFADTAEISLTLVYSSTNMSKSVWTSGFWKPLVHKNMSNFWNKSMFVKGCSSIRLESIKYHEGSNQHVIALSKHINKMKPTDAPAAKAYHNDSLNKALFLQFSNTDGPFLKKLPKFETFSAPSAGATTRQTYTLTCGSGILATERNVLVEALCTALECCFDDTSVVKVTAITDVKMWPTSEEELHTFGDDWMNTLLDQLGSYLDDKDDQVLGLCSACVGVLCMLKVWTSELWCGRVTFLNHSSTIRVPKNP